MGHRFATCAPTLLASHGKMVSTRDFTACALTCPTGRGHNSEGDSGVAPGTAMCRQRAAAVCTSTYILFSPSRPATPKPLEYNRMRLSVLGVGLNRLPGPVANSAK